MSQINMHVYRVAYENILVVFQFVHNHCSIQTSNDIEHVFVFAAPNDRVAFVERIIVCVNQAHLALNSIPIASSEPATVFGGGGH